MMKNDKTIEKLTARRIKNLGLDEPSADFTIKVMHAIAVEPQPKYVVRINYWWFLGLLPIFVAISWYLIVLFKLSGYVSLYWNSFLTVVKPHIAQFLSYLVQLKNLSIPPILIIGFIAMLLLLTLEDLAKRLRHSS